MPLPFTCFTSTFCILLVIIDLQSRAFCVSSSHGMHIKKYWFLQILVIWMCICSLRSHHINQLTYTSFWSHEHYVGLDCIRLHWIALDCIRLYCIALDWISKSHWNPLNLIPSFFILLPQTLSLLSNVKWNFFILFYFPPFIFDKLSSAHMHFDDDYYYQIHW